MISSTAVLIIKALAVTVLISLALLVLALIMPDSERQQCIAKVALRLMGIAGMSACIAAAIGVMYL